LSLLLVGWFGGARNGKPENARGGGAANGVNLSGELYLID
jgi:hypothetical protein